MAKATVYPSVARKEHKCLFCKEDIKKGEDYVYSLIWGAVTERPEMDDLEVEGRSYPGKQTAEETPKRTNSFHNECFIPWLQNIRRLDRREPYRGARGKTATVSTTLTEEQLKYRKHVIARYSFFKRQLIKAWEDKEKDRAIAARKQLSKWHDVLKNLPGPPAETTFNKALTELMPYLTLANNIEVCFGFHWDDFDVRLLKDAWGKTLLNNTVLRG